VIVGCKLIPILNTPAGARLSRPPFRTFSEPSISLAPANAVLTKQDSDREKAFAGLPFFVTTAFPRYRIQSGRPDTDCRTDGSS